MASVSSNDTQSKTRNDIQCNSSLDSARTNGQTCSQAHSADLDSQNEIPMNLLPAGNYHCMHFSIYRLTFSYSLTMIHLFACVTSFALRREMKTKEKMRVTSMASCLSCQ
jgi:hypothetical protein